MGANRIGIERTVRRGRPAEAHAQAVRAKTTNEKVVRAVAKYRKKPVVKGEFYPCKPDIFEATYEKVQDAT